MTIASFSFLLCITRREQVARIYGHSVYVIKDVAILPLSSQADADAAITQARAGLQKAKSSQNDDIAPSASEESEDESLDDHSVGDPSESNTPAGETMQKSGQKEGATNVVQEVVQPKGQHGWFASQWFSRRGWGLERKRAEGMNTDLVPRTDLREQKCDPEAAESTPEDDPLPMVSEARDHRTAADEMLPKILRSVKLLLTSRSFYFSYDFNITKRFGSSSTASIKSVSPESFDRQVCESSSSLRVFSLTRFSISGIDS